MLTQSLSAVIKPSQLDCRAPAPSVSFSCTDVSPQERRNLSGGHLGCGLIDTKAIFNVMLPLSLQHTRFLICSFASLLNKRTLIQLHETVNILLTWLQLQCGQKRSCCAMKCVCALINLDHQGQHRSKERVVITGPSSSFLILNTQVLPF